MALLESQSTGVRLVDVDCSAEPDVALGRVEVQARGRWERLSVVILEERAVNQAAKWQPVLREAQKLLKARALEMRSKVRRQLGVRDKRAEMLLAVYVDPAIAGDPAKAEKAWRDVREWVGMADPERARVAGCILRAVAPFFE